MSTIQNSRPSTPIPAQPMLLPYDYEDYLLDDEIPASYGPLAPPRNEKEIRKCCKCKQVYLIVRKSSTKTKCGYCNST